LSELGMLTTFSHNVRVTNEKLTGHISWQSTYHV